MMITSSDDVHGASGAAGDAADGVPHEAEGTALEDVGVEVDLVAHEAGLGQVHVDETFVDERPRWQVQVLSGLEVRVLVVDVVDLGRHDEVHLEGRVLGPVVEVATAAVERSRRRHAREVVVVDGRERGVPREFVRVLEAVVVVGRARPRVERVVRPDVDVSPGDLAAIEGSVVARGEVERNDRRRLIAVEADAEAPVELVVVGRRRVHDRSSTEVGGGRNLVLPEELHVPGVEAVRATAVALGVARAVDAPAAHLVEALVVERLLLVVRIGARGAAGELALVERWHGQSLAGQQEPLVDVRQVEALGVVVEGRLESRREPVVVPVRLRGHGPVEGAVVAVEGERIALRERITSELVDEHALVDVQVVPLDVAGVAADDVSALVQAPVVTLGPVGARWVVHAVEGVQVAPAVALGDAGVDAVDELRVVDHVVRADVADVVAVA